MINLLTEEGKKRNKHEYRIRLLIMFLFFLFTAFFVSSVFLIPSYFLVKVKSFHYSGLLRGGDQSTSSLDSDELKNDLREDNMKINNLFSRVDEFNLQKWVGYAVENINEGIVVDSFDFKFSGDEKEITIGGVAKNRDELVNFDKRIKASGKFKDTSLPTSSLVKNEDIDFKIKITLLDE